MNKISLKKNARNCLLGAITLDFILREGKNS